jgi:predicted pyridoxine 5'-phosphate oxidase superfamily flavin-nucleotide-binding protein
MKHTYVLGASVGQGNRQPVIFFLEPFLTERSTDRHVARNKRKEPTMAKIPKEVQEFVKGKMAWVSTATPDGIPNATPKGSVRVIDEEHVVFADLFSRKTRANLQNNPRVAVTVVDEKTHKGYQLKGTAELLTSGPLYDEMAEQLKKAPTKLPPLNYVVAITVNSVYDQSVGPEAGKQIA